MGQELKADGEGEDAFAFIDFHLSFMEMNNHLGDQ